MASERSNHPPKVDPTVADIRHLRADDDGGPVVMLNLLRFTGDEGRASYAQYVERMQPFLARVGATLVHVGDCSTLIVGPGEHRWDVVMIASYPSRDAFLQMLRDPEYQAITHLRTAGLEAAVLQATTPWLNGPEGA
jgi:uncharacterized protein (DUF1330 family)